MFFFSPFPDHFPIRNAASRYGVGSGDILLDNIICTGRESSLLQCGHNPLRDNNCDHTEDAGVICGGQYTFSYLCVSDRAFVSFSIVFFLVVSCDNRYIRLVNDSAQRVVIKDTLSQGRVEVCVNGRFNTVCDSGWNNIDASIVCTELGFSRYGMFVECF